MASVAPSRKAFAEARRHGLGLRSPARASLPRPRPLCGERCQVRRLDVTDQEAVKRLVAEAEGARGRIDILVNNAGGVLGQTDRPIEESCRQRLAGDLRRQRDRRLLLRQAVAPGMKSARCGRIVNISSGAGLGDQPDRHPGLRQLPRRRRSALPASSPTSWAPGTSPSTMWRRASYAPTRPRSGSGNLWARTASSSSWNRSL